MGATVQTADSQFMELFAEEAGLTQAVIAEKALARVDWAKYTKVAK